MIKTYKHFWIVLKNNFYTVMSGGFHVLVTANIEINASDCAYFGALNVRVRKDITLRFISSPN